MALITLYDRYAPTLLALLQNILGASTESDELLQELFLEVWCKASTYQPQRGTVRAWLILRARERGLQMLEERDDLEPHEPPVAFLPPDWDPAIHPAEVAGEDPLFGQERAAVQRAVGALPRDQQRILAWYYFANTGPEAATKAFPLRPEHMFAHLTVAHQQLREIMHQTRR